MGSPPKIVLSSEFVNEIIDCRLRLLKTSLDVKYRFTSTLLEESQSISYHFFFDNEKIYENVFQITFENTFTVKLL